MKSKMFALFLVILISYSWIPSRTRADVHKLRIAKLYTCDNSNKTFVISHSTIKEYDKQSYVDIVANLLRDVTAQNLTAVIEKCDKSGANCEIYSRFVLRHFCTLFQIKHTFWSSMVEGITPKPQCPNVKKGTYELRNGTMHVDHMIKLFPDTPKYYWKLHGKAFTTDGDIFACGSAEGYLV